MSDPDILYYDILFTNFNSDKSPPIPVNFSEKRIIPILKNSNEYKLSITRFQIDTQELPVFLPEIQINQDDRNKTIYSVTLVQGSNTVRKYIQWETQSPNSSVPPPPSSTPSGFQNNDGTYYYCYSFQYWASLINKTLALAFEELQINEAHSPIFSWDYTTNQGIMTVEKDYYSSDNSNPIEIYFNNALYALFSSFPAYNYGVTASLGKNYKLIIDDYTGSNTITMPIVSDDETEPYDCIQCFQEYSTTANWTPINSIVFTSSSLPIVKEQLSAPIIYNETRQASLGNNANFGSIITDLQTNELSYKPNLIYNPSAQYRYISLESGISISQIDVQVYWKNRFGLLTPLYLGSGSSCSLKILFEKIKP